MEYLNLPFLFVKFWFIEAPFELSKYFARINNEFLHLFSLPLMLRTLLVPWKNEYRKQFVLMAIVLGFVIKTFFVIADLALLALILLIEVATLIFFVIWPFLTLFLLTK